MTGNEADYEGSLVNRAFSGYNQAKPSRHQTETEDGDDEMKMPVSTLPRSSANHTRSQYAPTRWSTQTSGRLSDEHELTEIAAPSPALSNEESNRRLDLEEGEEEAKRSTRSPGSQSEKQELTEIAAPGPSSDEELQQKSDLEKGEAEAKHKEGAETITGQQNESLTLLYTISYLILFSIFGTLARLGTQWLGFYPGAPVVISNLWANFGGCLVMGFLSENKNLFTGQRPPRSFRTILQRNKQQLLSSSSIQSASSNAQGGSDPHPKRAINKKKVPLFVGLTTGFCGSFTSFSTFSRDMFFALSNEVATPENHPGDTAPAKSYVSRNPGWSVNAVLAIVLLTVCVNMSALQLGAHIALLADHVIHPLPYKLFRKWVDPFFVFLAFGCWIGAVLLAALPPDRPGGPAANGSTSWSSEVWRGEVLFALVFAPLGCLLRWYLSSRLNGRNPSFPLGTFIANIFGVTLLAMCYDIQHSKAGATAMSAIGGQVGCQVLQGIEDGFCGCLTTVSTWILELKTLRRRHAYLYGGATVLAAFGTMIILMGSVLWSVGFVSTACVTDGLSARS